MMRLISLILLLVSFQASATGVTFNDWGKYVESEFSRDVPYKVSPEADVVMIQFIYFSRFSLFVAELTSESGDMAKVRVVSKKLACTFVESFKSVLVKDNVYEPFDMTILFNGGIGGTILPIQRVSSASIDCH